MTDTDTIIIENIIIHVRIHTRCIYYHCLNTSGFPFSPPAAVKNHKKIRKIHIIMHDNLLIISLYIQRVIIVFSFACSARMINVIGPRVNYYMRSINLYSPERVEIRPEQWASMDVRRWVLSRCSTTTYRTFYRKCCIALSRWKYSTC